MNFTTNTTGLKIKHRFGSTLIEGVRLLRNKNFRTPVLKKKEQFTVSDRLKPTQILGTYWSDWNEPDIIKFKAAGGGTYIIEDENLLKDVCKFMDINGFKGLHPYIHIEGEYEWECYPAPSEAHLLEYLGAYNYNYDIYTPDGRLVREANNEKRKFNLNVY